MVPSTRYQRTRSYAPPVLSTVPLKVPTTTSRIEQRARAAADSTAADVELIAATVYLANDVRHGRQVALKVLKPEVAGTVGADRFIKGIQWDEGEGLDKSETGYGGAGYGKHKRPDLSNTTFMVEALKDAVIDQAAQPAFC